MLKERLGSFGEFATMSELLKRDIEAYQAISKNQEDYDITVVVNTNKIVRLQVKTTELQNKSTNNSIKGTNKNYDYLILVVINNNSPEFYILSKSEVEVLRGNNIDLSVSQKKDETYWIGYNN